MDRRDRRWDLDVAAWGYLKHFEHIGRDVATYFDVSCFEASASDDADAALAR